MGQLFVFFAGCVNLLKVNPFPAQSGFMVPSHTLMAL
jgi:hypothetical protein